jgi:hypothetical protein
MALIFVAAGLWALAPVDSAAAQPQPTMVISPSSGPCDATVEITGWDFPPSTRIRLDIGRAGRLVTLTTDPNGRFTANVALGQLGCEAVRLDGLRPGDQIWVIADLEERMIEPGRGIPPILTRSPYTYITTHVAPKPPPAALPRTGSGPHVPSISAVRLVAIGVLAGVGLILVLAPLCHRRLHG